MKNILILAAVLIMTLSCNKGPAAEDLARLSGYWEIERVISDDGKKEYSVNETIDHFKLVGTNGVRTKVRPRLDGTYARLGAEAFAVIDSAGVLYLEYSLNNRKWSEEVTELTETTLVLRSKSGIEYYFKKPIPFSIK